MHSVNERSTSYLTTVFRDKADLRAEPSACLYRIDCVDDGTEIKAWTALTPASEIEIQISPAENAMLDDSKAVEVHRVTFVASYGANESDQLATEYDFEVKRVRFLSIPLPEEPDPEPTQTYASGDYFAEDYAVA
jgi:hypothetical protein